MARGFLSGMVLGGVVSVVSAGVVSILSEGPQKPVAGVEAPASGVAPEAQDTDQTVAAKDADLVRDGDAPQVATPDADDVSAATAAGSDTPLVPQTGGAEDLGEPAQATGQSDVSVAPQVPVLPSPQAALPEVPDAEEELSISTDPTQPPSPTVDEPDSAFAPEIEAAPETPTAEAPAPETAEAVAPTAPDTAQAPDTPGTPAAPAPAQDSAALPQEDPQEEQQEDPQPAPQEDIAALPSSLDPAPDTSTRPSIGTPAGSLVDRTPDVPTADIAPAPTSDVPPIKAYAIPFENPDAKPLMSIVLMDTGIDLTGGPVGIAALQSFPYPLTFAVDASLPDVGKRVAEYRAEGFEVLALLDLPSGATASDAEVSLSAALDAVPEAVAVMEGIGIGVQESRDVSDQIAQAVLETGHGLVLQSKGLNTAQKLAARSGVPTGLVFRDFDSADQTPTVIRRFLDQAAFRAGQEGGVIMVGRVRADTISALLLWGLQDRAERVALAPVSAVLNALSEAQ